MIALRFAVICAQLAYQTARSLAGQLLWLLRLPRQAGARRQRVQGLWARCLTDFFRRLGPSFIKLGQILSARHDLLPRAYIAELQTLQDRVPPFPFTEARRAIEEDLGQPIGELFRDLREEPVSAASIAQVHEGHLSAGEHVAVKVRRPRIERTMRRDFAILAFLARAVSLLPGIGNLRLPELADELARAILAQLDFPLEMRNNRRFAENFRDVPYVRVPEIYDACCGRRVITMSFVAGGKLTEVLEHPPIDRQLMAERVVDMYLKMSFEDFFIHADLHPGNLFVDADGSFVLLDTGLVAEVPERFVQKYFRLAMAIVLMDGELIADAFVAGQDLSEEQRRVALAEIEQLFESYKGRSYFQVEMSRLMLEILGVVRRHRIHLDREWSSLVLSDITFEGIAKIIDRDIDIVAALERKLPPYVLQLEFLSFDDPLVQKAVGILIQRQHSVPVVFNLDQGASQPGAPPPSDIAAGE